MNRRAVLAVLIGLAGCSSTDQESSSTTTDPKSPTAGEPSGTTRPNDTETPAQSQTPSRQAPLNAQTGWQQYGGGPENSGYIAESAIPDDISEYWSLYTQSTAPVIEDEVAYTIEYARKERLVARSTVTGEQEWSVDIGPVSFNIPAVHGDAVIVPRFDSVEAFSRTDGESLWKVPLPEGSSLPLLSRPNGVIAATGRGIVSVSVAGEQQWQHEPSSEIAGAPAVTDDGIVYTSANGELIHVSGGKTNASISVDTAFSSGPAVDTGISYQASDSGTVSAIDLSSGDQIWEHPMDETTSAGTSPAVDFDSVYVPTISGIVSLDKGTGEPNWTFEFPERGSATTPVIDSEILCFGTYGSISSASVFALSRSDGTVQWNFDVNSSPSNHQPDAGLLGPPTPTVRGVVLSATDGLHALGPELADGK